MLHRAARLIAVVLAIGPMVVASSSCGEAEPSSADAAAERQAIAQYRAYLEEHTAALASALEELIGPIRTHKVPRSQSLYVIARVPYGQVEPAAESFAHLDSRIRRSLHRIEESLWVEGTADGLKPVAKRLLAQAKELSRKVKNAPFRPIEIASDVNEVLREDSVVKLGGKEQPYSDADLVDVAANVEGVKAAYESLKPLLAAEGQDLGGIRTQFAETYSALRQYGRLASDPPLFRPKAAGAVFATFNQLSPAEIRKLSKRIDTLANDLSEALTHVVRAEG